MLCLTGCDRTEIASLEPAATAQQTEQAGSLEQEETLAPRETAPPEVLNAKELTEEHPEAIERYRKAFVALLKDHRTELEQISAQMLQLKEVYYNRDYDACAYPGNHA